MQTKRRETQLFRAISPTKELGRCEDDAEDELRMKRGGKSQRGKKSGKSGTRIQTASLCYPKMLPKSFPEARNPPKMIPGRPPSPPLKSDDIF